MTEPPIGASANRWTPSMAQNQPHTVNDGPQNSAPQEVPSKLGGGPQKYKYTIEQLLSIYADLSEKKMLVLKDLELNHVEELPAAETEASLLKIVNDIAQQMVYLSISFCWIFYFNDWSGLYAYCALGSRTEAARNS